MPSRQCKECRRVMPASEFEKHRQRHVDIGRERPGSSRKWRRLRDQILRRDGHKCVACGARTELEIHHVDGDWRNNDPDNLEVRCTTCNPRGPRPGGAKTPANS